MPLALSTCRVALGWGGVCCRPGNPSVAAEMGRSDLRPDSAFGMDSPRTTYGSCRRRSPGALAGGLPCESWVFRQYFKLPALTSTV